MDLKLLPNYSYPLTNGWYRLIDNFGFIVDLVHSNNTYYLLKADYNIHGTPVKLKAIREVRTLEDIINTYKQWHNGTLCFNNRF